MKKYLILILFILAILSFFTISSVVIQTGRNEQPIELEISKGEVRISSLLREHNVIRSLTGFRVLSRLLGLENKIQAGRYRFKPHETLISVLFKLVTGDVVPKERITAVFPEGTSIYKMGSILEKAGFRAFVEFRGKALKKRSLEGYLFPDTYILETSTSVEVLVELMLKRFNKTIGIFWEKNKNSAKLSFYDTLILASIIEKEAKFDSERPIIASVFYNRLNAQIPLAADPTIKYALEKPTKRVYSKQLQIHSPYNTYKNRGLPPTPICNPGLESFKAAVYPKKTNYLYFVAKKDGAHIFSNSWDEHQKARGKATPTQ